MEEPSSGVVEGQEEEQPMFTGQSLHPPCCPEGFASVNALHLRDDLVRQVLLPSLLFK